MLLKLKSSAGLQAVALDRVTLMSLRNGLHHQARAGSILANCTSSKSVFLTCITNMCRCRWWGRWGRTMFTQCCRRWIPRTHCGKSRSAAPSRTAAASRCCAYWTSSAPNGVRMPKDIQSAITLWQGHSWKISGKLQLFCKHENLSAQNDCSLPQICPEMSLPH